MTALQPRLATVFSAAATALAPVLSGHRLLDGLPDVAASLRPAVQHLVFGTLRDYGRGSCCLSSLLEKPLPASDAGRHLHALLLLALFRLHSEPLQAHTTVNEAVAAAGRLRKGAWRGLTNAVLRNAVRRQRELEEKCRADLVASSRHPAWWLALLKADWPEHWSQIVAANNSHPPMTLRVNLRRTAVEAYRRVLAASGLAAAPVPGGPGEALLLETPCPVDRLPGFADGDCSVQDAGAQWAAHWLDVADGLRVLDACAAPGGKSAHLLERAAVDLLALDVDPVRAARIGETFRRLGLSGQWRAADAGQPDSWWDGRPFDRILADVPCSASGVARRHPDAKWLRRAEDIVRFAGQQAAMLDALWPTLAVGGKMLYCTCSVFRAENDQQMAAFLTRHRDACRLNMAGAPDLQLLPTESNDGFYFCLLQKVD